ncbi:MAG: AbrB/MazE/SpoVT family DNA-binding domain-containing protein [Phycisphaerales bacterium]
MIKKLTKAGNSQAMIFDRTLIELMGIDENTSLKIEMHGTQMTITPIKDADIEEQVAGLLQRTNKRYGAALKKMAE